jgi:hypothetical protein
MDLKILNDPLDKGTCRARLNSKLLIENKLALNEWILIESTEKQYICKAFPLYSSFHSFEYLIIDESIKSTENKKNDSNQLKIKKINQPKKSLSLLIFDLNKAKGEEDEEEDEFSKLELIGLIISVGFILFQRWKVLEINEQKEIDQFENPNFHQITKETKITIQRESKEEKIEESKELTKPVGGLDKVIEEIEQVALYPILYSEKFKTLSPEFPKGILIIGEDKKKNKNFFKKIKK